mgnify:CR=1 FL=1
MPEVQDPRVGGASALGVGAFGALGRHGDLLQDAPMAACVRSARTPIRQRLRSRRAASLREAQPQRAGVGPRAARDIDDFASMHEVVLRRYRKVLENGRPVSGSHR